jgi:basic membrane lipoprotein Med (substrate-binding protein (PBP1-ABC) superfamily)
VQAAVKENPKVKYVGTTFDASSGIPKQIITSVVNDFDVGYGGVAQLLKDKKLKPQIYTYGVAQGGLKLTPFTNVSQAKADEGMKLYDDIKNGTVKVDGTVEVSK